jgi:hypothetical protein
MTDATISISKIIIKIGETEISLSLDEARELKNKLGELFPNDFIYPSPYVIPYSPNNPYPYWTITVGDTSSITTGGQPQ